MYKLCFYFFRWLDYSNIGDVIEGTRIITFKVPLKEVNKILKRCVETLYQLIEVLCHCI
jgi:hypothetical protein